ncbi:AAEL007142-PA [Aedes aegypti]|uniref:Gustatory receptor n=1 Tax=Aedes aegypti TaxID=7159 RepID=Q173J8_AEDAE|nr:gustatory receptor 64 [Aedes aegypti]EAT41198.2 AAEL007142-PA [Aedes aegypti]
MKIQCPVSVKQVAVESGERPKSSSGKGSNGNLLQHLRPLFLVSRLFSLNPFRIVHKSGKEVQISSTLGILQCVAACVGYGAFHLYTTYSDDFDTAEKSKNATRNATDASDPVQEKSEQNFVSVMIDTYNRYSGLGLYWVLVIGAIGNRRILIRFVESLQEVDQIFETKLNVVVNNLHWKRVICIQMTLIFAIIFLFEYFNCIVYLSDYNPSSVYCMPDCYLVLLTEATAESQIVGYIKLLQMRFQLINQLLTREAQNHNRLEIINEIKNLYAHLHLLSLNINKAYGVQLVFILMTLFVTLTTLMYHCNMKAIRLLLHRPSLDEDLSERYWEVLSTFFWVALSAYRIFRICNICNATKNEASQIGCLIHGLGMNTNCIRTKTTVKLFSLQLLQQKVEFSACGLLAIDHGLVFNIVGAVTTYILILLQFDVAQNRSQWQRHD